MRRALLVVAMLASVASTGCRTRVRHPNHPGTAWSGSIVTQPMGSLPDAPWTDVRPPNSGFACQMPPTPLIDVSTGAAEDGATFQTVRLRAQSFEGDFAIMATAWEGGVVGNPLAIAHELAETVLELAETQVHRTQRISVPGFYAREDTGQTSEGTFFALRQFFGRDRIYVAIAAVRNEVAGYRAAERFMRSITLDPRDALLPVGESTVPVAVYVPDVDFTVNMPPLASRRPLEVAIEDARAEASVFESRHASGLYRVTVILFEDGVAPDDALARVARSFQLGEAGAFVHASGFPGRAYEPDGNRRVRAFVTAQRVYVLEITGAASLAPPAQSSFFDSLRIL